MYSIPSWPLTSLKGVDAVFVLAGQDHHRPAELAISGHLPTLPPDQNLTGTGEV